MENQFQSNTPPVSVLEKDPKPVTGIQMDVPNFILKNHAIRNQGELFHGIGIYGWKGIEDIILAGFARGVGSNIIFVGEAGCGKTGNARILGAAFYGADRVRKVDTQFEDELSLGICDIPDMSLKKMVTFKTDHSLLSYDVVILDELNRSNPSLQKIYLPVLEDRAISGHRMLAGPIFATMNPLNSSYEGVEPLDKAMAERITLVIPIPEFQTMDAQDRLNILKTKSARAKGKITLTASSVNAFKAAVYAVREEFEQTRELLLDEAAQYVDAILMGASTRNLNLQSSRTGQHLVENLLWLQTVRHVVYGAPLLENLGDAGLKSLRHSIVAELYTDPIEDVHILALHKGGEHHLIKGEGAIITSFNRITDALLSFAFAAGELGKQVNETERNKMILNSLARLNEPYHSDYADLQVIDQIIGAVQIFEMAAAGTGFPDQAVMDSGRVLNEARYATLSQKLTLRNGAWCIEKEDEDKPHSRALAESKIFKGLTLLAGKKRASLPPTDDPSSVPALPIRPLTPTLLSGGIQIFEETVSSWVDVSSLLDDPLFRLLSLSYLCLAVLLRKNDNYLKTHTEEELLTLVRARLQDWESMQSPTAIDLVMKKGGAANGVRTARI